MSESPDLPGDLLALAHEDLAAAEQAVEKALKTAIASRDFGFPFTHDLGLLMQL